MQLVSLIFPTAGEGKRVVLCSVSSYRQINCKCIFSWIAVAVRGWYFGGRLLVHTYSMIFYSDMF
jgi:hypothetical protein